MNPVRLAAPWYIHPAEDEAAWQRMLNGETPQLAVVNIASGYREQDPYYAPILERQWPGTLLGYVNAAYGQRPASEILAEATRWLEQPAISGIMLDCVPSQIHQGHWELGVIEQLRSIGAGTVVANPGTLPDPALIEHADLTCVAEQDWQDFQGWQPPAWLRDHAAERLWMLVHNVPSGEQQRALQLCASRGAGYAWVTSGQLPNPWSTLPETW